MNNINEILNITIIHVKDNNGGYSSYFAQFPNIIAEGDTEKESTKNLFNLVNTVFSHRDEVESSKTSDLVGVENFTTESFKLSAVSA